MTFLAPWWLAGAGLVALMVTGLHLLARRRPRPSIFPTARFIPDRPASAAAPASRPSDLFVLLLRVLAILLLGIAFARPQRASPRRTARILLIDRSRAARTLPDSQTIAAAEQADLVIVFDSVARAAGRQSWRNDSSGPSTVRGSLSVALLAALRALPSLREKGDSATIAIASPLDAEEWDEATLRIRALWPGGIQLLIGPSERRPAVTDLATMFDPADPLGATFGLIEERDRAGARLLRETPTQGDSTWARSGGTIVFWPKAAPSEWARSSPDTISGVVSGPVAVVAPFVRSTSPPRGEVVARWIDGAPAATQVALGSGCLRSVGIPIVDIGDFPIRSNVVALLRKLMEPCGFPGGHPVSPAQLDSLRGTAPFRSGHVLASSLPRQVPANAWFLVIAGALLLIEMVARRRRRSA